MLTIKAARKSGGGAGRAVEELGWYVKIKITLISQEIKFTINFTIQRNLFQT